MQAEVGGIVVGNVCRIADIINSRERMLMQGQFSRTTLDLDVMHRSRHSTGSCYLSRFGEARTLVDTDIRAINTTVGKEPTDSELPEPRHSTAATMDDRVAMMSWLSTYG